jgi:ABC-2 type transport system permease protein
MSTTGAAFRTAMRVTRQSVATRGRILTAAALAAVILLLAVAIRIQDGGQEALVGVLINAGLVFQVPVVTLVFAASAFGDFTEDETLVYLWLRPLPRWHLAVAATCAALVVTIPMTAVPLVAAALIGGTADFAIPVLGASALGTAAYGSLFVALGLRAKRALTWGLIYVLIWEGILGGVSASFARVSIRRYVVSAFTETAGVGWEGHTTSAGHAIIVLAGVVLAGVGLCTWFLHSREIE